MPAAWPGRLHLAPVRPWDAVPRTLILLLVVALVVQCLWSAMTPMPRARAESLPPPPPRALLAAVALGEQHTLATLATLWLQFHDTQPGYSVPFRELDYDRVRAWLEQILDLAPGSEYPLLLAVRIYAQVNDPERTRKMLAFVSDAFVERPQERWRWLAEAALIARHRLEDPRLALRYAQRINRHTRPGEIPHWARDLQIFLLEDLGELQAARVLIGGLLASGEIEDPHELRFLEQRLQQLEAGEAAAD